MAKRSFISILIFMLCFLPLTSAGKGLSKQAGSVNSKDDNNTGKIKSVASPNWVHPELRENYKGYTRLNEQKINSRLWKHTTNRPSGNIVGGGTVEYNDYKPFYLPQQKK